MSHTQVKQLSLWLMGKYRATWHMWTEAFYVTHYWKGCSMINRSEEELSKR